MWCEVKAFGFLQQTCPTSCKNPKEHHLTYYLFNNTFRQRPSTVKKGMRERPLIIISGNT